MAKEKTKPTPPDERVKKWCDSYIEKVFSGPLPADQEIEIRLAFYAGMAAGFQDVSDEVFNAPSEMAGVQSFSGTRRAIRERADRLNRERENL